MKTVVMIAMFMAFNVRVNAQNKGITDPIRDYYQFEMATADASNKLYTFKGEFTGHEHKSIFITDDQALQDHGLYSWSIYYPAPDSPNHYIKILDATLQSISGPVYVGYINEVKSFGLVYQQKRVVGVQFLKNGSVETVLLDKDGKVAEDWTGDVYLESFPKYFINGGKIKVVTYSLQKLMKMYH